MYDFTKFKERARDVESWLMRELSQLRTGRASPAILDAIQVESYGAKLNLKQVATVSIEDSRTLRIVPWDISGIKAIEKAIAGARLGLSVAADETGLRVIFPELTSEHRLSLVRLSKDKLEEAKVSLRKARDEIWTNIQIKERTGQISEDDKFRYKSELQKIFEQVQEGIKKTQERKEKEILQ